MKPLSLLSCLSIFCAILALAGCRDSRTGCPAPASAAPGATLASGFDITVNPTSPIVNDLVEVCVKVLDSTGDVFTDFSGSVELLTAPRELAFPASLEFAEQNQGEICFQTAFSAVGPIQITAVDLANSQSSTTITVDVLADIPIFVDSGQTLGTGQTFGLVVGDLDMDGDLDVASANLGQNNILWMNDGSGQFMNSGSPLAAQSTIRLDLGDVDGDMDLDIICSGRLGAGATIWINDGTGTFTNSGQVLGDNDTVAVAFGDVDGDGDIDAMLGNWLKNLGTDGNADRVYFNDGNGAFADSGQRLGNQNTADMALADIDNDGDLDLVCATFDETPSGDKTSKIYQNDGLGNFSLLQSIATLHGKVWGLETGDVDNDGDMDLALSDFGLDANPGGFASIWFNDGTGNFSDSLQMLGDGSPINDVKLGDLDMDGDLDLVLAQGNWTNCAGAANLVFLNQGNGTFFDSLQQLGNQTTTSLGLGDFNGDATIDIFAGNDAIGACSPSNRVYFNQ